MSQSVNGYPDFNAYLLQTIPYFRKLGDIHNPDPAHCLVFIEENEETIEDGQFGMPTLPYVPNANEWYDLPSSRHNQGGNLSFTDGHVEHWKWAVPKIYQGWMPQDVTSAEEPDYQEVRSAMRLSFDN